MNLKVSNASDFISSSRQTNVNEGKTNSKSVIDDSLELTDPNPDVLILLSKFNEQFFWGQLSNVEVKWSRRLTRCAGICICNRTNASRKFCCIRLSEPLLKFRQRKDIVETLLHEMIHAYVFLIEESKDSEVHGPLFQKHMQRVNEMSGTNITVCHHFFAEVDKLMQHWWRCNGPCQLLPPDFGFVRRTINRPPKRSWKNHHRLCWGTFTKVKDPNHFQNNKDTRKTELKDSLMGTIDVPSFPDKRDDAGRAMEQDQILCHADVSNTNDICTSHKNDGTTCDLGNHVGLDWVSTVRQLCPLGFSWVPAVIQLCPVGFDWMSAIRKVWNSALFIERDKSHHGSNQTLSEMSGLLVIHSDFKCRDKSKEFILHIDPNSVVDSRFEEDAWITSKNYCENNEDGVTRKDHKRKRIAFEVCDEDGAALLPQTKHIKEEDAALPPQTKHIKLSHSFAEKVVNPHLTTDDQEKHNPPFIIQQTQHNLNTYKNNQFFDAEPA